MSEELISEDVLESQETTESVSELETSQTELDNFFKEDAAKAGTEEYEKIKEEKVQQVRNNNNKLFKKIAKQSNIDITDSDETLSNFDEDITELQSLPIDDLSTIKKGQAAEAKVSNSFIKFFKSCSKSVADSFRSKFLKSLKSDVALELKPKLDQAIQLGKKLNNLLDIENPTDEDRQNIAETYKEYKVLADDIQKTAEKDTELKNKIESKEGSEGMKKVYNVLKVLGIIATIGLSIWGTLAIIADSTSGCYMYYNSNGVADKFLLSGCSQYYSKEENQNQCSCQYTVPINQSQLKTNEDCKKADAAHSNLACNSPFCLGRCDNTNPMCSGFPNGQILQCTDGTINQVGYVSYAYIENTPLSIIGNVITAVGNIPGDVSNAFSKFFGSIGKYLIIFVIVVIVLIFLWILFRKLVLKD